MNQVPGSLGTTASLALRLGQAVFSSSSLIFMCLDVQFYGFTAFCYLVTVMGLVVPWSITFVVVDTYSVFVKSLPRHARVVLLIILGDWVLSYLTLSAACSTASATSVLIGAGPSFCHANLCSRYRLSAIMAFLSWFLSFASSLFNLWLLPSFFGSILDEAFSKGLSGHCWGISCNVARSV